MIQQSRSLELYAYYSSSISMIQRARRKVKLCFVLWRIKMGWAWLDHAIMQYNGQSVCSKAYRCQFWENIYFYGGQHHSEKKPWWTSTRSDRTDEGRFDGKRCKKKSFLRVALCMTARLGTLKSLWECHVMLCILLSKQRPFTIVRSWWPKTT